MRRLIPIVALALGMSGCASGTSLSVTAELDSATTQRSTTTRKATTTTTEEETTTTTRRATTTTFNIEDIYLIAVKKSLTRYYPNSQLLLLAHQVCDGIAEIGADAEMRAILGATVSSGFSAGDMGAIAGSGVAAFCPEYSDALMAAANRYAGK